MCDSNAEVRSERLIPLTYVTPFREHERVARLDEPIRPMMKCVACGTRTCARTEETGEETRGALRRWGSSSPGQNTLTPTGDSPPSEDPREA